MGDGEFLLPLGEGGALWRRMRLIYAESRMHNAPAHLGDSRADGPILKMTGVSKRFPGVRALESVHLEVGPSEIHALLGENGAGKSTLLKILSGAHSADAGQIELFGHPV